MLQFEQQSRIFAIGLKLKRYRSGIVFSATEFKPFKRIKTIKAIKIDAEMLELLGSEDGNTAMIKVSWDEKGMKIYKDGYLADYEYGIAPHEMQENYELAPK
ncbi:hypothetical protein FCV85_17345 [Vibrio sp. F13]|nr:hypothetical protein FCV85_17345 [Vibrio sp. F13]